MGEIGLKWTALYEAYESGQQATVKKVSVAQQFSLFN